MTRRALPLVVAALLGAPASAHAADDPLGALHSACKDDHGVVICSAAVSSFDGTLLDTTLTLPPGRAPRRGRPLIVFLHGLLADKTEYLSDTVAGTGPDRGANAYKTVDWNNRWFAARGYAVLNYSARGHGSSAGQINLASKNIEVRDTRVLTGLLADAQWAAINPGKVGVIGSSYGGGQAWLLLATRDDDKLQYGQWRSPAGRLVQLTALVPTYTWTDLVQSLLPNGHQDSRTLVDPKTANTPLGVAKQTLIDGFIASAGTRLPQESYMWLIRTNAGEPYDGDPLADEAKRALSDDRSAYFQDGYFAALRADAARRRRVRAARRAHHRPPRGGVRQRRVPVLAAQGFTDPIFVPIEVLKMRRRLNDSSPGYPIAMYFGDFEHLTSLVKIPDLRAMHDLGTKLLDHYLRGRGRRPAFDVHAAVSNCDPKKFGPLLQARSWEALAPGVQHYVFDGPQATASPLLEPRGLGIDPVVVSTSRGRGCMTTTSAPGPGVAHWQVPVQKGFTMAGLPRLRISLTALATNMTLASRLWDVAPDGTHTLVTRGALRLVGTPIASPVTTEMFGNAWRFEAGHALELELTQVDTTYLRPDSFPSAAVIDSVEVDLPTEGQARATRAEAAADRPRTIPALQRWAAAAGTWALGKRPRIVVHRRDRKRLLGEARQLAADLGALTGRRIAVTTRRKARRGDVLLSATRPDAQLGSEGYELRIGSSFRVSAPTAAGVFYGGRTLLQLLKGGEPIPRGQARDWPRYPERGLMIDVGRRVDPPAWIASHIRDMAYLKLNLLHIHLTDDQRWGIQSDTHPEIVSPDALTKRQLREILELAARHHVTVVPEIDMPGHMGAVLAKHPDLELKAALALSPPQTPDTRKLDITNPEALRIVKQLLEEYLPLFPGPYWHVGGDEYMSPAMYPLYPQLQTAAIAQYGPLARTKDELLGFFNWVDAIVRAHGKTLRAWQDELAPGGVISANSDIVAEWWISFSPLSEPRPPTPQQLLASGNKIMNAGWFPTYYTGDVGPIQGKPNVGNAYETWAVNQFCTATAGDQILEPCSVVAPDEPNNLGSKINAWDNHELTLAQIADGLFPRLRMLAQKTWDSPPLTPSYADFERVMTSLGHAPGF